MLLRYTENLRLFYWFYWCFIPSSSWLPGVWGAVCCELIGRKPSGTGQKNLFSNQPRRSQQSQKHNAEGICVQIERLRQSTEDASLKEREGRGECGRKKQGGWSYMYWLCTLYLCYWKKCALNVLNVHPNRELWSRGGSFIESCGVNDVRSNWGEVPCSGTPRHSGSRGSN